MKLTFANCNLFKRSFTNLGIGFTANNEVEDKLMKKDFKSKTFFSNTNRKPSFMKSASLKDSFHVVVDNNVEEVERYEEDYQSRKQPTKIQVSLHNPVEPADIRTSSFEIPLGHSTIVYITPKATEVDEDGKELTEFQRNCRLNQESGSLNIFKVYTKVGCLFECNLKHAIERCGCVPWNYPFDKKESIPLVVFHHHSEFIA